MYLERWTNIYWHRAPENGETINLDESYEWLGIFIKIIIILGWIFIIMTVLKK